jgi:hypothetical protein
MAECLIYDRRSARNNQFFPQSGIGDEMSPLLDLMPAAEPASLPWFQTCCARWELPAVARSGLVQIGTAGPNGAGGMVARAARRTGRRRQREHASRWATGGAVIPVPVEDLADLSEMLERRGMLAPEDMRDRRKIGAAARSVGRSTGRGVAEEGLRTGSMTRYEPPP